MRKTGANILDQSVLGKAGSAWHGDAPRARHAAERPGAGQQFSPVLIDPPVARPRLLVGLHFLELWPGDVNRNSVAE